MGARAVGFAYLLTLLLPFVYYTVMHGRPSGQTLGKKWLGIAGEGGFGRRIDRLRPRVRPVRDHLRPGALHPADPPGLPRPLWDKKNQALHDKVVGSIVVKAWTSAATRPVRASMRPMRRPSNSLT